MKVRNGFVSNSSSSSFVIALPHEPKDRIDLMKMLFGDNCTGSEKLGSYFSESPTTLEAALSAFEQIRDNGEAGAESIVYALADRFDSNVVEELPKNSSKQPLSSFLPDSIWSMPPDEREKTKEMVEHRKKWDKYLKSVAKNDNKCAQIVIKALKKTGNKKLYVLKFSDETHFGSELERGDAFTGVPYIRFSHH